MHDSFCPGRWAARLYPKAWRERYGEEFDALIEDAKPGWGGAADVLWGSMKMRIDMMNWRAAAGFALMGLVVAGVTAYRTPERYVSEAVLQLQAGPDSDPEAVMAEAIRLEQIALSRTSLARIINDPDLNLYQRAREITPLEDVIEDMKGKDLKVENLHVEPAGKTVNVRISYAGGDAGRAKGTLQRLIRRLFDDHQNSQRLMARMVAEGELAPSEAQAASMNSRMEVLTRPGAPSKSDGPNWWLMAAAGMVAGVPAGFAAWWILGLARRSPRAALAGVALALLAAPASLLVPQQYISTAVVQLDSLQTLKKVLTDQALLTDLRRLPDHAALLGDVRVESSPGPRALIIRVHDADRFKAQRLSQIAVTKLVDAVAEQRQVRRSQGRPAAAPWVDVIDPPSMPVYPVSFLLPTAMWMMLGGLLTGITAARLLKMDSRAQTQRPAAS